MPRLVTAAHAARRYAVSDRTIRNYIGNGYFPAYRIPGQRGILVDLDEVEAAMNRLPRTRAKASAQAYGPKAQIVVLPASTRVMVTAEDPSCPRMCSPPPGGSPRRHRH